MSIVDHESKPVGYGWNDIAAAEAVGRNPSLRLISDEEFERRFPDVISVSVRVASGEGTKFGSCARG